MTSICLGLNVFRCWDLVSPAVIISSIDDLFPVDRQAITWTNADLLSIGWHVIIWTQRK